MKSKKHQLLTDSLSDNLKSRDMLAHLKITCDSLVGSPCSINQQSSPHMGQQLIKSFTQAKTKGMTFLTGDLEPKANILTQF